VLIFEGIRTINGDRIVAGTLVITGLALAADRGLAWWGARLRRDSASPDERGG
jgi:ABC-type proline/glycine betaine transport system permease subunit